MNFDAVVIGAGPAGAVTARELARRGCSVLLVDKAHFPRPKVCGCCVNAAAVSTLRCLGLAHVLAGGTPLRDVQIAAGRRSARVKLPGGVSLSREAFDVALVNEAIKAGVQFRDGVNAKFELGKVSLGLSERPGLARPSSLSSLFSLSPPSITILASGLAGSDTTSEPHSRVGAGVSMPAEAVPAFFGPGTIFMATGRGGYVGLVRVEDGRLDVAAAFDVDFLKEQGGLGPAAEAILNEVGWRVPGLTEMPWKGTPALTRRAKQLAGERWFAVGDAAGYVEPFTGEGMAWAVMSAATLAPIAARGVHRWDSALAREWEATHRRVIGSRQRICRVVSRVLRSPLLTKLAVGALTVLPVLSRPVVAHLNRSTSLSRCEPMSFAILGLGTAHPPDAVTAEEGLALARVLAGPDVRTSNWLGPIYSNSGIARRFQVIGGAAKRDALAGTTESGSPFLPTAENDGVGPSTGERMAIYAEEAGPLALRASAAALVEAAFVPESITHLVTVSCTGFVAPGVDFAVITGLGLKPTVARTHVGFMGCHGALNGLRVANAFATADPAARVLVCAVELCSLHYYYGNAADKLIANAIFADGAAAVVGKANPERERRGGELNHPVAHAPGSPWSLLASGSCLIPNSAEDMGWTVGDHGFEMSLSRRVPGLIAKHLRPWLEEWLGDNGQTLAGVGSWAVHPGGPKIVSAVEESLGLSAEALAASRGVFSEYGNVSSPTVLFILKRLREANAPRPCVALGFGPGLVAEAALFV